MVGTRIAELAVAPKESAVVDTGAGGHEHVVDLVAGMDLPGFGCPVFATKDLAGSSVIEDPADAIAAEPAAESLLNTAGFDKVVAALGAAAALAAAVVTAQVKESPGKQEDPHQH